MSHPAPGERDWDASTYDRISDPQFGWAMEQLERLELAGSELVLDAGCGSGRVTEVLAQRVPRGHVYAVDAAPSMVAHTQARLGEQITALCQDLLELELPEPVDVIFSNATFHWIGDHGRLFTRLCSALAPGGRLLAQCGGRGNIDAFRRLADTVAHEDPFARYFVDWHRPWNYASSEETAARLQQAGFAAVRCWLEPKQVVLEQPRPFVATVCLVRHLDPLPEELRERFLEEVLARAGQPLVLDYVRLNMVARRAH
ncbi:MAG: methyltransferase domain-containing protein [Actinomycetota bacterium]|nr:methyltransferase domain-containing protein [Actinomycetota bacterium]